MTRTIDPMTLAMQRQTFSRFRLPGKSQIRSHETARRSRLTARFQQGQPLASKPILSSAADLLSRLEALDGSRDSAEVINKFYDQELDRMTDIYCSTRSPIITSQQLAQLRQAVITWVFRLANRESPGNLALVLGGSAVNGVHTYLTDVDFIVIPHAAADREAASNVQNMMIRLAGSLGIKADGYLTNPFGYRTFEEIGQRYLRPIEQGEPVEAAFYFYLMDARVIDATGPNLSRLNYGARLEMLKEQLTFSLPERIAELAAQASTDVLEQPLLAGRQEIKNNPLRLFQYALNTARACLNIRESNYWDVLAQLALNGFISEEQRSEAFQALCLFIDLRHLLAFGMADTMSSYVFDNQLLEIVAQQVDSSGQTLQADIERGRASLNRITQVINRASAAF